MATTFTPHLSAGDTLPQLSIIINNGCADALNPSTPPTPFDLTGCTVQIRLKSNDLAAYLKTMDIPGPATNGIVTYTLTADDLTAGILQWQVVVTFTTSGQFITSGVGKIIVDQILT